VLRLFAAIAQLSVTGVAAAFDPLGAMPGGPATPAARAPGAAGALGDCPTRPPTAPLPIAEAVSRSLCQNPETREAWAAVKLRAAAVGAYESGYLPNLLGAWQDQREYSSTKIQGLPEQNTSNRAWIFAGNLALGWLLYDFGHREATIDQARQLYIAEQASLDENLQETFLQSATDYYAAQAGYAAFDSASQVEATAQQSRDAAKSRVGSGVASISDQLQAETALAQAKLNQSKAHAEYQIELGVLALDMGLEPDAALTLPATSETAAHPEELEQSAHRLIEQAKHSRPIVAEAEAELAAARSNERMARSQDYPSISLNGKTTWSDQPTIPGLGINPVPAADRDSYIGIQVRVPLFDGFARRYQIEQAKAQTEYQQSALIVAQRRVAREVWSSYQSLHEYNENLSDSKALLDSAEQAFEAARQRYTGGAGNMLELLSAQAALANARFQRIQALAHWYTAQLQLAASLGELGFGSIVSERP